MLKSMILVNNNIDPTSQRTGLCLNSKKKKVKKKSMKFRLNRVLSSDEKL